MAKADPADVAAVAAADQRLAIRLLQTVDGPGNVSVSPTSLYLALGMLQNAARGQTGAQISDALQAAGLSTADQNAGLAGLTDELAAAAKHAGIALESANSLWQQRDFPVRKQFLADLATYYRTGVWQADFADHNAEALDAINQWTAQHTHGKITKLFDQLDPKTVLVLANAIYFHAAWATPFDGELTKAGPFTTGAGNHVTAEFMTAPGGLLSGAGTGYEAAQLPYQDGRFAALAVMPTSGSLADFVATPHAGAASTRSPPRCSPARRWRCPSSPPPRPPISCRFSRHSACTTPSRKSADLSGLSPECGCQVDQVLQRVYLQVAEKGTTAAAVTGAAVSDQARSFRRPRFGSTTRSSS